MEFTRKTENKGRDMEARTVISGTDTPPFDLPLPPPPSSPPSLSANASAFVPTSSLLNQARDVLYPNNPQGPRLGQHSSNFEHNFKHGVTHSQSSEHQYTQQQKQQQITMECASSSNSYTGVTNDTATNATNNNAMMTQQTEHVMVTQPQPPPWVSQMMFRLAQIESHLLNQNMKWQNVDAKLQDQNNRMSNMEHQVNALASIKPTMTKVQLNVISLNEEVSQLSQKMNEHDTNISKCKDMYHEAICDQDASQHTISELCKRVDKLEMAQSEIHPKLSKCETEVTDLQCRSMRDNLLFFGIEEPEQRDGIQEDTEQVLNEFLETEMQISYSIPFHRVHRIKPLGKHRYTDYPRPIVAKFERFKDREHVRTLAPQTLKGKPYSIREQFPKPIEEQRKLLYPEMKRAKLNKENKVRLVKDKLYINDIQYVPKQNQSRKSSTEYQSQNQSYQFRKSYTTGYRNQDYNKPQSPNKNYTRGRIFERSKTSTNNMGSYQQPRSNFSDTPIDFTTPNRFGALLNENFESNRSESRKNKASSPLDSEVTLKKSRELDSGNSEDELNVPNNYENNQIRSTVSEQMDLTCYPDKSLETEELNPIVSQQLANDKHLLNDPLPTASNNNDVTENQSANEA